MSDDEEFPSWMVPNGETWAIPSDSFERQTPRGVVFVQGPTDQGPQIHSAMVVLDGPMKVVGEPGGWGWTSVACGSDATGWVNLVVRDYRLLAGALLSARGYDSENLLSVEEMLGTSFDAVNSAVTFLDVIMEASRPPTDSSAEEALLALEQTAAAWETLFNRFTINRHRVNYGSMDMLMYSDNMQTYALLEDAKFLEVVRAESRDITPTDVRIASALSRLRTMTSTLAPGNDVDKRCWEAIGGHIAIRPAVEDLYRRTAPDLSER